MAVLHFLHDLLAIQSRQQVSPVYPQVPAQAREALVTTCKKQGEQLLIRLFSGLIYTFPRECVLDASGLLMAIVSICPEESIEWVNSMLRMLPAGTITNDESQQFLDRFSSSVRSHEDVKIKAHIQDFTSWYRRRNVTPRSRIGHLGASDDTSFHFNG